MNCGSHTLTLNMCLSYRRLAAECRQAERLEKDGFIHLASVLLHELSFFMEKKTMNHRKKNESLIFFSVAESHSCFDRNF